LTRRDGEREIYGDLYGKIRLFFVFSRGAVLATHAVGGGSAINALVGPVAVDVFPGRGLQTAVPIGGRSTIDTVFFIIMVLVKPVQALGTAAAVGGGPAVYAFCCHGLSPYPYQHITLSAKEGENFTPGPIRGLLFVP
jgi:hypothetical protein